ncbi:MAG TPA: ABC transporter permease [Bryobacteraceae bacterium]|nr:ABC transporter permease [Bryobacteraceae bacterium]
MKNQFRHVLRRLLRSPMFTIVTLITIGVAVGANTAIFSVINGILLRPLPYPDPERLVSVAQSAPTLNLPDMSLAPADYFNFAEENQTFESFGLWNGGSVTVTGISTPEQLQSVDVTQGTLNALGIQPALGRIFNASDDSPDSPETVLISFGYWQRRFGGDGSVIGRQIRIDGESKQIIGVLPQNFRFLDTKADLIQPFRFNRGKTTLGNFSYEAIARLKPGVSLAQANADVARMLPLVLRKFPAPPGFSTKMFADVKILPNVRPLKHEVVGDLGQVLWVLMGSIGVVLLIACANIANLLLVRTEGRQHELAIRATLGAGSGDVAGEILTESVLLGVLGGAVGLGLAYWALQLLVEIAPAHLPRLDNIRIDPGVVLFTLAISLLAGLAFGLIPVIRYSGANLMPMLRAGGRTLSQSKDAQRVRNSLVVLQTGLAVVLLIGSGLMIRTFQTLRHVRSGFADPAKLQTLRVYVPEAQIKEPERVIAMFQEIQRRLAVLPGVTSTSFANSVPTDQNNSTDLLYAQDHTYREGQLPPLRRFKFVAPGFFETMGIPLAAGRDYSWTDINERRPVTMVSENLAREMWGDPRAALGKRVREGMKDDWREIIGVVGDVRLDGPDHKAPTTVYWPIIMTNFWGNPVFLDRGIAYVVRSQRSGSEGFLKEVREAVWSADRDAPLARVRTMQEIYSGSMARSSFTLVMLAIAGGMALLLGIVGIYGVVSYSVLQRKREIGIRLALGAQRTALEVMVVRQGLLLAGLGIVSGLIAAVGLTRFLAALLYEVNGVDPLTYGAVSIGLLAAAAAASYLPARRASSIDPVEALRAE